MYRPVVNVLPAYMVLTKIHESFCLIEDWIITSCSKEAHMLGSCSQNSCAAACCLLSFVWFVLELAFTWDTVCAPYMGVVAVCMVQWCRITKACMQR